MRFRPLIATIAAVVCLTSFCAGMTLLFRTPEKPWVVFGLVLDRADWPVWLFLGGIVAGLVARVFMRWPRRERDRKFRRILGLGLLTLVLVMVMFLPTSALWAGVGRYVSLGTSPGGCKVVGDERNFLTLGSVVVWVVPRGGEPNQVHTFVPAGGLTPLTTGHYKLQWRGDTAVLTVQTDQAAAWEKTEFRCA